MSDWNDEENSSKFPTEEENNWNDDQSSKFPQEEPEPTPETPEPVKVENVPSSDIQISIESVDPSDKAKAEARAEAEANPNNLNHYEAYLIKESTEKTHAHKRFVKADKQNNKVRITVWKDKKSNETAPLQEFFFSETVTLSTTENFKTTKKSPTVPKDKEFKHSLIFKQARSQKGKPSEVVFWAESEKKAKAWETALNDMVNLIRVEQARKNADKLCNIQ